MVSISLLNLFFLWISSIIELFKNHSSVYKWKLWKIISGVVYVAYVKNKNSIYTQYNNI